MNGSLVVSSKSDHLIQLTDQVTAKMTAFPVDLPSPIAPHVFSTGAGPAWGISRSSFSHSSTQAPHWNDLDVREQSGPGRGQVRQVTCGERRRQEEEAELRTASCAARQGESGTCRHTPSPRSGSLLQEALCEREKIHLMTQ